MSRISIQLWEVFVSVVFKTKKNKIEFKIQEAQEYANQTPKIEQINLELNKQTLSTMIDGFTKIKQQLNTIAGSE